MILDVNGKPLAIEQTEAQIEAATLNKKLKQTRYVLTADEIVSLKNPRVRLEKEFTRLKAYFFTIDGELNGKAITGALFAGECMLVFAFSFEAALKTARGGLNDTIEIIALEFDSRSSRELMAEGISADDVAGRRAARPLPNSPQAQFQRRKLAAMLDTAINGVPFKQ